ncbi:MAG TPA: squalene/phytoene synthase family protein [Rhodospirillaceae bacterium]|nr:squalene/phytoene synthase family protein [Rhodospirillaceae bacterium]
MKWQAHDLYCRDLVREAAHESYVTSLFAPADRRPALWAIFAFNHEIAKTRETVSETTLGEIRLQWWRDAIGEIYDGSPRRHQVVQALDGAVGRWGLSRGRFETLIDGRARDLSDEPFRDSAQLLAYLNDTTLPLNRLVLQVVETGHEEAEKAADAAAAAYGLTGLLRAAPYFFGQNRNFIPLEVMVAAGVTERMVRSLRPSPELCEAVRQLAEVAVARLEDVADLTLPREAFPALFCAAQARWHLSRLEKAGYDPYDPELSLPIPFHELRLAFKRLIGRWM